MKYLGVFFQSNLSCCKYVAAKASKSLNFLRHTLWGATTEAKSMVSVRPSLEYACTVWNPHTVSDKSTVESVQRRAAYWACGSCWSPLHKCWNKSSNACLQELRWPTLSSRRNYLIVAMLYALCVSVRPLSFLFLTSRHTIVCHVAKYSQCRRATDKCVFYRNQENAFFTHP